MDEKAWAEQVGDLVKEFVSRKIAGVRSEVLMIEERLLKEVREARASVTPEWLAPILDRIEELEARGSKSLADSFRGGYLQGTAYRRGDVVQRSGHVWLCMADETRATPGSDASWRMLLRGNDR